MKILMIGNHLGVQSGVQRYVQNLLLHMDLTKYQVDLFIGQCPPDQVSSAPALEAAGVHILAVPDNKKDRLRALCRHLHTHKDYDIIHIHHPDPMAAMALRLSGYKGKVVLHWHSDILSQKALLRFYLPIQNWLIKRADTIVGTTPVYLAESPYLQGVQEKCRCIPIGIEPVISDSAREQEIRNEYSGRRIIFSLGRLVEYKGYRYLIEAAKYLDDSFMILIGGGGPLRESLQREIDELGVGSRVKLLGKVPQEDLASYYGACELFCMSSVMKTEAFGIVQIEAMSAGRPVVATKIPESGVSWVNEDGVSGINVAPRDSKAIAEAILTITDNEATWKKFSAGAAKRFAENFTKEKMISKCLNIYAETLSLH